MVEGVVMENKYTLEEVLSVLDAMFMDYSDISVDDWFRDNSRLFQGREEFIERMKYV